MLSYNYLGDRAYAEAYVSYKGQKTGRRKIIYELITIKGIDKNVAQEVAYAKLSDEEEIEKAISMAQKVYRKGKGKKTHAT
ncbi:MAG: RecX family transcriptional regulator [Clostridiales bacterium]|nr:MAG: RecX family transcriptional regulator [Clostridiales bacterium]